VSIRVVSLACSLTGYTEARQQNGIGGGSHELTDSPIDRTNE